VSVTRTDEPTEELSAVTPEGAPRGLLRRHKRPFIAGAAVVLAAGAGIGIWLGTSGGSPAAGVHITTAVVSVTTGTIKKTVSASGTIEPAQESALDFAVSGKVTAVDVVVGQKVAAGQTLASVGATALQAQEAAAQESLSAAESKLSADESSGASTSELASDEAAVTSAKDQLTTAEKAVADADLTSPIAGTVASVDLSVGEDVSGSGSLGDASHANGTSTTSDDPSSSSTQIEVVSTDTFVVNTTVDDTEVGEVSTGDQAVITPTGSTTDVYGTVASVGMVATNSGGVPSFPVSIDVTGTPSGVYAGSGADVSIVVKQLDDVVEVPSAAISYKGARATVTVVESDGRHVSQSVTVGTTEGGETQITRGLRVGEKLVEREVTFSGPSGTRTFAKSGGFPGGGRPGGRFIARTGGGAGVFGTGGLGG
jgi:membrane fusion protein, macrolide-specific efflux system